MKTVLAISSLFLAAAWISASGQTSPAAAQNPPPPTPTPPRVIFQPPTDDDNGGVLPNRVGGGTRGVDNGPQLEVLVPDKCALTTEGRPMLYWYQSEATTAVCEFSVTEPKNPKPVMLRQSTVQISAGIHCFRVDADLKPAVTYRWSVAIEMDPANRSQDAFASGIIRRIDPSPNLAAKLVQAHEQDKPALYAANGIWYDALESLSEQIKQSPNNEALKQERASLLKQVGLGDATFDTLLR